MVAYLRRPDVRHDALTDGEKSMLGPMITASDNDRANQVYGIVGEEGLYEVARKAEMKHFTTMPDMGRQRDHGGGPGELRRAARALRAEAARVAMRSG